MSASAESLRSWLAETRAWADRELEGAFAELTGTPGSLLEGLRYAVFGGGKRLRPALVRTVCRELGGDDEGAAAPAVAIEWVHTYSLVHDDLPCMDDDDLRRGRPTCHKAFGEAVAVLVGDGLQAAAFEVLASRGGARAAEMAAALARAAGPAGMVGGQALDLEGTGREVGLEDVRRTHRMKTAALFAGAAELGAIAAGAERDRCARAGRFGEALGLCFQAVDDVLDVTGDAATLGKTPGKDAAGDKPTLVAALGLEAARAEAARLAEAARTRAREAGFGEESLVAALVERVLGRDS